MKFFHYDSEFPLESGDSLPNLTLAYQTYGKLSARKDNVVWVCHALTANAEVADWWPHTVEKGCFLDPDKYFIVCANIIGSHYGSTGPLSINPDTGSPWYNTFPLITIRDIVRSQRLLADHLGIDHAQTIIGSSVGGFQCLEWLLLYPDFAKSAVLIATAAKARPWAVAFNESQRMAIETDPTFGFPDRSAGLKGMGTARSIALLSYRGGAAYNKTQQGHNTDSPFTDFRASSYQRHQAEKLRQRFNAYSYYRLSQAFDSHDIARGRGEMDSVLRSVACRCCIIAVSSDILFPPSDLEFLHNHIPNSEYHLIDSDFGHDGFLVEHKQLNEIITQFEQRQDTLL